MWPSQPLLDCNVFKSAGTSPGSQSSHLILAENAYLQAEAIWKAHGEYKERCVFLLLAFSHQDSPAGVGLKDVMELSPKFWKMHMDPILLLHGASATILTIHSNLALGTISSYLKSRRDLKPIVEDLVNFTAMYVFLFFCEP